ncbi:MAG: DUF4363 family protein [Oscillospiraceae bacterium]
MKRLYICLAVIAAITGVCIFSMHRISEIKDRVEDYSNAVFTAMEEENYEKTLASVGELTDYWMEQNTVLVRYVRHAQVDDISKGISRLESLARYQVYPDLAAELSAILWQMEQIWDSERVHIRNVM